VFLNIKRGDLALGLIKCKNCGTKYNTSTIGENCPTCGFVKKKFNPGCLGTILIIVVFSIVINVINGHLAKKAETSSQIEQAKIQEKNKKEKKTKEQEAQKRLEKEKQEFISSIEERYNKILSLVDQKEDQKVLEAISIFEQYQKMDYKNIQKIHTATKTKVLYEKVKSLPASHSYSNMKIYRELKNLNPDNELFRQKYKKYFSQYQKEKDMEYSDLHLLNWSWGKDYNYVVAKGQVKNLTNEKILNAKAEVTWYDKNGEMITYDYTYLDLTTLMPGQTSNFKIMERWNPAMNKASIRFTCSGAVLKTYREK
jgi:hypothetical protein